MEKSFEHAGLEEEIKNLSLEIKERGLEGKEGVKTLIREKISPVPPSPAPLSSTIPPKTSSALPGYLDKESPELRLKIEKLLDLAFHKGLKKAAKEAKGMSALEVDAFHDALTDKFYNELKQRGLLK